MSTRTYAKVFQSIFNSTVWTGSTIEVKVLWITLLGLKNIDDDVFASVPGLAKIAEISVEKTREALEFLKSADPDSTTKEYLEDGVTLHPLSGRRIWEIDGGWHVINGDKYRRMMSKEARREYQRNWMADKRASMRGSEEME
jgi:hypothetical protein